MPFLKKLLVILSVSGAWKDPFLREDIGLNAEALNS